MPKAKQRAKPKEAPTQTCFLTQKELRKMLIHPPKNQHQKNERSEKVISSTKSFFPHITVGFLFSSLHIPPPASASASASAASAASAARSSSHTSHTTHLTQLISHNSSHTTHLTPLISHNSPHTTHLTHNSSHTQLISHTTHLTELLSHISSHTSHLTHNSSHTQVISHTTHLTQVISHTTHLTHNSSHTIHLSQLPFVWQAQYTELPEGAAARIVAGVAAAALCVAGAVHRAS